MFVSIGISSLVPSLKYYVVLILNTQGHAKFNRDKVGLIVIVHPVHLSQSAAYLRSTYLGGRFACRLL